MRLDEMRRTAELADMADVLLRSLNARKAEIMEQNNSLGRLNAVLFDELERLNDIDVSDEEATKREIERSRAIEGTAKSITENGKTILQATRMRAEFGMGVQFPKMLGE